LATNGLAFTPAYTRRGRKLYRYYVSTGVIKRGPEACTVRRVPAAEIERAVVDQVRTLVLTPEIVVRTWKEAREHDRSLTEDQVRTALAEFSALWDELFPAEQSRIIQLLVERVEIQPDRLSIKLCRNGLVSLANEIPQKAA
jgi:site-specific DNA recombinase